MVSLFCSPTPSCRSAFTSTNKFQHLLPPSMVKVNGKIHKCDLTAKFDVGGTGETVVKNVTLGLNIPLKKSFGAAHKDLTMAMHNKFCPSLYVTYNNESEEEPVLASNPKLELQVRESDESMPKHVQYMPLNVVWVPEVGPTSYMTEVQCSS